MLKKMSLLAIVTIACLAMATPASSVMPADCDEMLNGGGQGAGHGCVDQIMFMYECAGPWDGSWNGPHSGAGTWPPY